jgi:hypothetical protein
MTRVRREGTAPPAPERLLEVREAPALLPCTPATRAPWASRRRAPVVPLAGAPPCDVDALCADPARVEHLSVEELLLVLERCAVEHGRLAAVERVVHGRLRREVCGLLQADEGLLTARAAARRLGVSSDYVREHGAVLGIAVPLDGVVRYDPAAVEQLRRVRHRDEPPGD